MNINNLIRAIPDYPKKGIIFRDITTLLQDREGFRHIVDEIVKHFSSVKIDYVAGIEARGFILGGAVAHQLSTGFLPIRKKGKLPWKTISVDYTLEYGVDTIEIHTDVVKQNQNILIVDDLIATGGTACAAVELLRQTGANIIGASFVIDLPDLGGRKKLIERNIPVHTLTSFDGD